MRICCDTGGLLDFPATFAWIAQHLGAADVEDAELIAASISIFEVLRFSYRTSKPELGRAIVAEIQSNPHIRVIPLEMEIAQRAAGYAHGMGLHAADAIVLSSAVHENCDLLLTVDHHFESANRQGVIKVEFL